MSKHRGGAPKGAINLSAPDGAPLPLLWGNGREDQRVARHPVSVGSAGYLTTKSDQVTGIPATCAPRPVPLCCILHHTISQRGSAVPDALADIRYELAIANRMCAHEGVLDAFGHASLPWTALAAASVLVTL